MLLICLAVCTSIYYRTVVNESVRLRAVHYTGVEGVALNSKRGGEREIDASKESLAAAQGVIDHLSVPWPDLLKTLEESTTDDVAILRIDPDPARSELRITADAVDIYKAVKYASSLQAAGVLSHIYVGSQRVAPADPSHPVQIVLVANWLVVSRTAPQHLAPATASASGSL